MDFLNHHTRSMNSLSSWHIHRTDQKRTDLQSQRHQNLRLRLDTVWLNSLRPHVRFVWCFISQVVSVCWRIEFSIILEEERYFLEPTFRSAASSLPQPVELCSIDHSRSADTDFYISLFLFCLDRFMYDLQRIDNVCESKYLRGT